MKLKQEIINLINKSDIDIYVRVSNEAEWSEAVSIFTKSGVKASPHIEELTYSGQIYVKFGRVVGWFWTSNYEECGTITLQKFKDTMCEATLVKPVKVYDKQVLALADIIKRKEALITQLKDCGAQEKTLRMEMGI